MAEYFWPKGIAGGSTFITSVDDTPSIDLDVTAEVLTADLNLSPSAADAGFINAVNSIEASGLQTQVPIADTSTTGVLTAANWNTFNSKQAAGNYITALTGDATAAGPGSAAMTLATVNGNVGTFGAASNTPVFTVNAKGLITAAADTPIQIAESQVTNLVSDLAGKQPTGNYVTALTGDVTASGPGSVPATLATVNSNVGTFGTAANVSTVTVNAKGLVTAASNTAIQITESQVTNLVSDLAAKQSTTLANGSILIGNGSNVATSNAVTGDVSLSNSGVTAYSGIVPLNKGGSNKNMTAVAGGVVYTDSDSMEVTSAGSSGQYLKSNGSSAPSFSSFTAPTVQKFTSGSGTYTTPAGVSYIRVVMVGGGGGGGGSTDGSFNATSGSVGSSTTFGTTLLTCGGGGGGGVAASAGAPASGGTGGTATLNSPGIGVAIPGSNGGRGSNNGASVSTTIISSGFGGISALGGGAGNNGGNAGTNSGSGGAGAGGTNTTNGCSGGGGGAGGYIEAVIPSPSATYSYSVGANGGGGNAGTNGNPGGNGAVGQIIVFEYYQ